MIDYRKIDSHRFEFTVRGTITKREIEDVWARFGPDMPPDGKIRVLEIIEPIDGITPTAVWEDLRRGWPVMNRVARAAIVADQGWVSALTNVAKLFVPAQMKVFASSEIDAARHWLDSDQA